MENNTAWNAAHKLANWLANEYGGSVREDDKTLQVRSPAYVFDIRIAENYQATEHGYNRGGSWKKRGTSESVEVRACNRKSGYCSGYQMPWFCRCGDSYYIRPHLAEGDAALRMGKEFHNTKWNYFHERSH